MSKIDFNEAKKLAKLSRLEFSDEELSSFVEEFSRTLEYVAQISNTDTTGVDLKEQTINAKTELRKDEIKPCFSQDEIIFNAPEKEDGAFLVPTTVEEGGA